MPTETSPPKRGRKPKQPTPVEPVQTTERIFRIPLSELHPFPDHPYGIREDQAMQDTVDSVKANGVVVPAIVRPRVEGGYEIIAGHRRKLASEQAGFADMPCIVRNLTDDEAIIQLVDSNAQREDVLPSERAKAYKMRLEAIKRTAGRPRKDLTENAPNNSANFRSDDEVGSIDGISGDTVRNIISLTNLVPELMQMVDEKKISLTPAYQIAALTEPEQRLLLETIDSEQATPSVSQAQRMRKLSQSGELNLYKYDREDEKLLKMETLINAPLTDAVLLEYEGEQLMFATKLPNPNGNQLDIYVKKDGQYVLKDVVEVEGRTARMGGNFFRVDGTLYRVAQDNNECYGGALILQKVVVTDGKWLFEDVRRLTSPHPQYTTGFHTFNICKGTVVVDIHGYRRHAWLSSFLTKAINSVRTRR